MTDLVLRRIDPNDALEVARAWVRLDDAELKRRGVRAASERNLNDLWQLTLAHAVLTDRVWSHHTAKHYRYGLKRLLREWQGENLIRPSRDAGPAYVMALTAAGLKPSTLIVRVAAARALYRALRWSGATTATPFDSVRLRKDPTPPWEKRQPYREDELERILDACRGPRKRQPPGRHLVERVVILLGAHAGLRAFEMLNLEWSDIDFDRATLVVRSGKGKKRRTVNISPALLSALQDARHLPRPMNRVKTDDALLRLMHRLCDAAGVPRRGLHALRHAAGTRLLRSTGSLLDVANHLGHANLDTARTYAKWTDTGVRDAIAEWT